MIGGLIRDFRITGRSDIIDARDVDLVPGWIVERQIRSDHSVDRQDPHPHLFTNFAREGNNGRVFAGFLTSAGKVPCAVRAALDEDTIATADAGKNSPTDFVVLHDNLLMRMNNVPLALTRSSFAQTSRELIILNQIIN